jgi:DNA mismatch repair protein MutL
MLEFFKETTRWEDPAERAAAAFACKAAIKAGTSLSSEEMVALIEALFRTGTPFQCPHGRPTYIKIEIGELDRRFGRI